MKLSRNSFIKFLAAVLAIASLSVGVVSVVLTTIIYNYGGYNAEASAPAMTYAMYYKDMYDDMEQAVNYYALSTLDSALNEETLDFYEELFSPENTNFFFTITDYNSGEVLLQNYADKGTCRMRQDFEIAPTNAFVERSHVIYFYDDAGNRTAEYFRSEGADYNVNVDVAGETLMPKTRHILVECYVRDDLSGCYDNYTRIFYLSQNLFSARRELLIACAVSAVVALASMVFLFYGAGRRKGTDAISLRLIDTIPWDVFLLLCGGITFGGVLLFFLGFEYLLYHSLSTEHFLVLAGASFLSSTLLIILLTSFSTRFKVKGWWKNSLIVRVLLWLGSLLAHPFRALAGLVRDLPLIGKTVLLLIPIPFIEFACLAGFYDNFFLPIILFNLATLLIILACAIQMQKLRRGCQAIADGDMTYQVDTRALYFDFRRHGEDLNRIRTSISAAVDERLKSERFKTELITNVSHDLKTPLTSIVNYVDLLGKLELPEQAAEYVEVLRRQSARLKKLTEDLVEASKASTGNLPVSIQPIRLAELLGQVTAEYSDRMDAAGLYGVAELPDETLTVLGDGRYLWRVMDNLLSNVCKYAMPGTRVYISAVAEDGNACISIKNISRERLNISADALMERFVRGDASRNTEGSGLGLSIAQSLTHLMGGELKLMVDGDLFKAELILPLA